MFVFLERENHQLWVGGLCRGAGRSSTSPGKKPNIRKGCTKTSLNCPDITILISLFGLCLSVFLSFYLFITLIKCMKGLKSQKSLFVSIFLSGFLSVRQIQSLTKGKYRAARAAKKYHSCLVNDQCSCSNILWGNKLHFRNIFSFLCVV